MKYYFNIKNSDFGILLGKIKYFVIAIQQEAQV